MAPDPDVAIQALLRRKRDEDPWSSYRELHEHGPFYSPSLGGWVVPGYREIKSVMRHPGARIGYAEHLDAQRPDWRDHPALANPASSLANLDPPDHTRLRSPMAAQFSKTRVESLRTNVKERSVRQIDALRDAGGGDFLKAVALDVALGTIGDLLRVPPEDRTYLADLVEKSTKRLEPTISGSDLVEADSAAQATRTYWTAFIDRLIRKSDGDDLLSALCHEEALGVPELIAQAEHLFISGFLTAANTTANGLRELLLSPVVFAEAARDPDLRAGLVDELLRCASAFHIRRRRLVEDIRIDGVSIPAGSTVHLFLGAANRDPREFSHPDRLDLTRDAVRPLTFGIGPHACLGAALARLEIEEVFDAVLEVEEPIRFASTDPPGLEPGLVLLQVSALDIEIG